MTSKQFQERRVTLINYLRSKVNGGDWHAVSDAANDLRVLEAKWGVEKVLLPFKQAYELLKTPGESVAETIKGGLEIKSKSAYQTAFDMLVNQPTSSPAEIVERLREKEEAATRKTDHVLKDIQWKPATTEDLYGIDPRERAGLAAITEMNRRQNVAMGETYRYEGKVDSFNEAEAKQKGAEFFAPLPEEYASPRAHGFYLGAKWMHRKIQSGAPT